MKTAARRPRLFPIQVACASARAVKKVRRLSQVTVSYHLAAYVLLRRVSKAFN
jgi:hypothetical protein